MSNSLADKLLRFGQVLGDELKGYSPGLVEIRWLELWTRWANPRLRAEGLRRLGIQVAPGVSVGGGYLFTGSRGAKKNLVLGANCEVKNGVFIDLSAHVEIGANAKIGERVMILTSSHELGPREHRAGAVQTAPVSIHEGASIGKGSIILPGVVIGARAVVEENSVVAKEVLPETRVRGNPAAVVKVTTSESST